MGLGSKLMKIAEEKAKSYDKIRVTHGAVLEFIMKNSAIILKIIIWSRS